MRIFSFADENATQHNDFDCDCSPEEKRASRELNVDINNGMLVNVHICDIVHMRRG